MNSRSLLRRLPPEFLGVIVAALVAALVLYCT
jgi:hypothetical protein